MKRAMSGTLASTSCGSRNRHPATTKHHAMLGNVNSNRLRRPNVSMVQMAGNAKTKLTRPKPKEASRHCFVE